MSAFVFAAILVVGWLAGCGGTPNSPSNVVTASTFVGVWNNVDPNTGDNPQLQIRLDGGTIYVHGYRACVPFCDWGEASAPATDAATGTFTVNWLQFGISDTITLKLSTPAGPLRGTLFVHYTDGRPDRSDPETFAKGS